MALSAGGLDIELRIMANTWRTYPALNKNDVPFAQDCVGDQFILRDEIVYRLQGESGEIESLDVDLPDFFQSVRDDPENFLGLGPLLRFHAEGGQLRPGELLSVFPPYVFKESEAGVQLRTVPVADRLSFLATLSRALRDMEDGSRVTLLLDEVKSWSV